MKLTLLDGGMGQELIARSQKKPTALWSTQVLIDSPELIKAVHDDYFKAGADVATTNTYAIHHDRLEPYGVDDKFASLHKQACVLAAQSRDEHGAGLVAGSLGPTGWSYRPDLAPPAEQAAELYAEIAQLQSPYVDLFLCETMSSLEQARGAVMGAAVVGKPIWLSVSVNDDDGSQLRSGEALIEVLKLVKDYPIEALLINCSIPEAVSTALSLLAQPDIPIGGYANGFSKITGSFKSKGATVADLEKRNDLDPKSYADFVDSWITKGASIVGGCCEVGPAHIQEIASRIKVNSVK